LTFAANGFMFRQYIVTDATFEEALA
jgi:hypothetical protein